MTRLVSRRAALGGIVGAGAIASAGRTAWAQGATVRIVFPFAAGGSGDMLTRMVADAIRETTGRSVIVENRTGAGGRIGVKAVASAPPDGNTLLVTPVGPIAVFPHIFKEKLDYDPFRDLAPISLVTTFDFALVAANRVPAKTVADLVQWLKANPREQSYGSPGAGTLPHLFGLRVSEASGLDLKHVAYRGSAAALSDVVGGQIPLVMTTTADAVQQHRAGAVRVLATSAAQPFLPEVPTFEKEGYAISGYGWYGLYGPSGTPQDWIAQVSRGVAAHIARPENRDRLLAGGLVPEVGGPDRLAAVQKADSERWGAAVRRADLKPE